MQPAQPDVRELYERYGRAVYRRCQFFLRSSADAEDAMQEVFVKVVERYGEFRGTASPFTWIVRIATNHCLNILRSRRAGWRQRFENTVKVEAAGRVSEASHLEQQELLYAALARVPPSIQEAAVYYFVDEMTQEEAAAVAGCSVPTFRKRLRQFIRSARKQLKLTDTALVFGKEPV